MNRHFQNWEQSRNLLHQPIKILGFNSISKFVKRCGILFLWVVKALILFFIVPFYDHRLGYMISYKFKQFNKTLVRCLLQIEVFLMLISFSQFVKTDTLLIVAGIPFMWLGFTVNPLETEFTLFKPGFNSRADEILISSPGIWSDKMS